MNIVVDTGCGVHDLAVEVRDPRATVDDLLAAVSRISGPVGAGEVTIDRRPVRGEMLLDDVGLREGSVVAGAGRYPADVRTSLATVAVVGGCAAGDRLPIPAWPCVVGRGSSAGARLDSTTVSRLHASFRATASGVEVTDLGSRNGTWVAGKPITATTCLARDATVRLGAVDVSVRVDEDDRSRSLVSNGVARPFNRPPRPAPPPAAAGIELPAPIPSASPHAPLSVVAIVGPAAMGLAMVLLLHNIAFALFALLSPVMLVGTAVEARRRNRRDGGRAARRYRVELAALERHVDQATRSEESRRLEAFPDMAEIVRRAVHGSVRLWERRPGAADFLRLRVGLADQHWSPPVDERGPQPQEVADVLARAVLRDAAVVVDLAAGPVAVVGPREPCVAVARALVAQAAVLHGPADLSIGVLTTRDHAGDWEAGKWLPHVIDPVSGIRLLSAGATKSLVVDAIAARPAPADTCPPGLLVVVDDPVFLGSRRSPLRPLLRAGATAIVVVDSADEVPAACGSIVELLGPDGEATVTRVIDREQVDGVLVAGIAAGTLRAVATALACIDDPEADGSSAGLPDELTVLPLLTLGDLAPDTISQRWRAAAESGRIAAPIGVTTDGVFELDLARDGPHGLIAGTTGAGKSELLRSIVVSLAATNAPDRLTFVLIDFKGGSAFDACARLPHTVGMVTDLDEHLAQRALRCLEAELRHRERRLRDAGASDLDAFDRSRTPAGSPLPRLLVVIDEFATLRAELPEFVDSLVGIAQRGRSLGVHLLLATQRPAGAVSDAIRANTNFRVSLRVQDVADSSDVLGAPDAALIPRGRPGRAYVRLGPGELIAMQSARSTGPPTPVGERVAATPFVFESARPTESDGVESEGESDLSRLVVAIAEAWRRADLPPPRRPWPDPLPFDVDPDALDLGSVEPGAYPIALADDPDHQRRVVWNWCPADGHLLVLGSTGSGTTTTLAAVALSVAASDSPERTHLYVVDCGAGDLRSLASLPHAGAWIGAGERERQARLIRFLRDEVERRRALADGECLDEPRVVVLIDGYATFASGFGDVAGMGVLDDLARVAGDGTEINVFFAIAADRPGAIPSAIAATARQRLVLGLADPVDAAAAGVPARQMPARRPGRAFAVDVALEVQVARSRASLVDAVGEVSARHAAPGRAPRPVGTLPTDVWRGDVGPARFDREGTLLIPIGVAEHDLAPAALLLPPGEHAVIAGASRSGRTSLLAAIEESLGELSGRVDVVRASDATEIVRAAEEGADSTAVVVLVDDADAIDDPEGVVASLLSARRPSLRIVAAARTDALRSQYGHWTRLLRRSRTGVLLQPNVDLDGELFGLTLPRRAPVPMTVGRGYLVNAGEVGLAQFARARRGGAVM